MVADAELTAAAPGAISVGAAVEGGVVATATSAAAW